MTGGDPWVVKLGGSLARSPALPGWLARLAADAGVVVVPGGGPFADPVRELQDVWRFDDACAHHMALLAMEQYGRMLCALQPRLQAAAGPAALARILAGGGVAVWMPTRMVLADPAVEQSWRVSADSLAAWLCRRLSARALVLVKSVPAAAGSPIGSLAADGALDEAFEHATAGLEAAVWWLTRSDAGDWPRLRAARPRRAVRIA